MVHNAIPAAGLHYRVSQRPDLSRGRSLFETGIASKIAKHPAIFPHLFRIRLNALLRNPSAPSVKFTHARRFFKRALLVDIDPARIGWELHAHAYDGTHHVRLGSRFLDAADWTGIIQPFRESGTGKEMAELVSHGDAFREMPSYRAHLKAIGNGRPPVRNFVALETPALLDDYFGHYLSMIRQIRAEGVLRRLAELDESRWRITTGVRTLSLEERERNPGAAIGADGRLLRFTSGRHRTAIAQALGLPRMPVEIRLVHVNWLADVTRRTGLPPHKAVIAGIQEVLASDGGSEAA